MDSTTYDKLKAIRSKTDLEIKPSQFINKFLPGTEIPLETRNYQKIGILHILLTPRIVLGDDTGLGKTFQTISALCYMWERESLKTIVITTKSAKRQWWDEFGKFTNQGDKVAVVDGKPQTRRDMYESFAKDDNRVLILHYHLLIQDYAYLLSAIKNIRYTLVLDEVANLKNFKSKTHKICFALANNKNVARVIGLTATLLKNRLEEGFGVYRVIKPDIFSTYNKFLDEFCIIKMQKVPGNRQVPIVVGHSKIQIHNFRQAIDPHFIGRLKYDVAKELPKIITRVIDCSLSKQQVNLYKEIYMSNTLTKPDGEVMELTDLTQNGYAQAVVNSPVLLGFTVTEDPKLETMLDLLENELSDEKVIIFSQLRSMVDTMMPHLTKIKRKPCRITGSDKEKEREAAKKGFQGDKYDTICITTAGSEAINLQQASVIILYDTPWSWGDYLQILGRAVRIGSPYEGVTVYHMAASIPATSKVGKTVTIAKQLCPPNSVPTIDYVKIAKIMSKKSLIEAAMAQSSTVLDIDKDDVVSNKDLSRLAKEALVAQ